MKYRYNLKTLLVALSALALATGCGKSNNRVNSDVGGYGNAFTSSNSAFSSSAGGSILNHYQTVKNSVPCQNGARLSKDVNFFATSGQFTGSKLLVSGWQPGFGTTGSVNKLWVGIGYYRDLMFVTQLVDSSNRVVGFNVSISFCEIKNSYTGTSFINDMTNFTQFATPNGIVLDSDTYCGYSMVDAAINTQVAYQNTQNSYYSTGGNVITTTFSKFQCNGRY